MQLIHDHHPLWAHAALDVCNAFPTLGRYPIAETLLRILNQHPLRIIYDTLAYFLLMYSAPGDAFFLAIQCLRHCAITDGNTTITTTMSWAQPPPHHHR